MSKQDRNETEAVRWVAIVPTLGASPHLAESVDALRRQAGQAGRIVVVAPVGLELDLGAPASGRGADSQVQRVSTAGAVGFARANLAGLEAAPASEYVALVNDDAVIEDGWADALLAELESHPAAAAAQGVVVAMEDPGTVDGAGLAWNRWWQAVQLGRGKPVAPSEDRGEIFGVSATAAMYRRRALDEVGFLFDEGLGSYYEDVDLAVRLRATGWTARSVPAARARHAGSTTGKSRGAARRVRRNRYLVLARMLGCRLLPRLPKVALRDAVDLMDALRALDGSAAWAIVAGSLAGLVRLPFALLRRPSGLLTPAELRRWRT